MSPAQMPLEEQDTADIDPELAERDRLACAIWSHLYLSRHVLDALPLDRLLVVASALGLDTSKGQ
jgi:hypothetical protein